MRSAWTAALLPAPAPSLSADAARRRAARAAALRCALNSAGSGRWDGGRSRRRLQRQPRGRDLVSGPPSTAARRQREGGRLGWRRLAMAHAFAAPLPRRPASFSLPPQTGGRPAGGRLRG